VLARVDGHWRILASVWSEAADNAKVNKAAKAARLPGLTALAGKDPAPAVGEALAAWLAGSWCTRTWRPATSAACSAR
ncbi:MAG TPA: hypothetical protein VGC42_30210, partial [Kofleriaceae bacterium]